MNTAVVIPGFRDHVPAGKGSWHYKQLIADLKKAGYRVVTVQPTWAKFSIAEWLQEAQGQLSGNIQPEETLLIGFSFGAMIAAGLAARYPFGKVLLCSLSPYFAEDIPYAKKWWLDSVGVRRTKAFTQYSFKDIAKNWQAAKTVVFLGTIEINRRKYPVMAARGREAGATLPHAVFISVPGAGHNIAHPNYAALIKEQL